MLDILPGCRIEKPPPKGYMCNCKYSIWACIGEVIKCNGIDTPDPESKECSGCTTCTCCSEASWNGNCNGYVFFEDKPKCGPDFGHDNHGHDDDWPWL